MSTMDGCKTNVNADKEYLEIELIGDCEETEKKIMNKLGPYGRKYWKKFIVKKPTSTKSIETPSE